MSEDFLQAEIARWRQVVAEVERVFATMQPARILASRSGPLPPYGVYAYEGGEIACLEEPGQLLGRVMHAAMTRVVDGGQNTDRAVY